MDGNVEITHIDFPDSERYLAETKYDFSFLSQIEEIKGYLLIFHVQVGYLLLKLHSFSSIYLNIGV